MKNHIEPLTAAIVFALLAAGAPPVAAHHSFAAFDMTAQKTVTGTVKTVEWTNPHTWFWLDVPNDQGVVETWGFEGMSPNYLARRRPNSAATRYRRARIPSTHFPAGPRGHPR